MRVSHWDSHSAWRQLSTHSILAEKLSATQAQPQDPLPLSLSLSLALSFSLCLRQQQHSGLHSALSPPLLSRCPSGARLNDMAIHFVAQQESLARLPRRRLWALPLTDRPRPGQGRTFISGGGARRGGGGCTGGTARCSCYAFINCFIII